VNIYFFTAVDDNPVYRKEAEILLASGRKHGRKIQLYDIPKTEKWNRYKVKLLSGKLPPADRYVYLDSDCVMTCKGDWEADDCQGGSDILYYCPKERIKHTQGFIRNHTVCDGDPGAYDFIMKTWRNFYCPSWRNSGIVVLDAEMRQRFMPVWTEWQNVMDQHSDKGEVVGDEAAFMFAAAEFGLPFLPQRFNGLCKWQTIHDWHVLIHADGNVTGEKRKPYNKAVKDLG
jgi:hypothetical protein